MFELLGWSYEPCYTICFDQDGEMLYADTEIAGRAGFAVQGKTINTLYVFIFDNFDDWIQMEQEGMSPYETLLQKWGEPLRTQYFEEKTYITEARIARIILSYTALLSSHDVLSHGS